MTLANASRRPCDTVRGRLSAAAAAPGGETACPPSRRGWVLLAAILGSSLAFIEGSVVGLAMPAIQTAFGVDSLALQWVANGYLLFLGACMLPAGVAGDRFGLRRVFVTGTLLFALGAMASALAPGFVALIFARMLQGLGGALLVPNSLALISLHFPASERGAAIGRWAGAAALTTAAGPVLGGVLVDTLDWRAVFFVVVPVALLAVAVTLWRVPSQRRPAGARQPVDWRGGLQLVVGLGLAIWLLTVAAERGMHAPPATIVTAGAVSALLLAAFLRRQQRHPSPMVPLRLFRSPAFSGANGITVLLYAGLGAALYFLPFHLIQVQGWSATAAGASLLPFTLIIGVGSSLAGGPLLRLGVRRLLVAGPCLAGSGLALLALLRQRR